ncbi:MAG: AAA family ATPase, partial [Magnetococcus sp. DMHC-8]
MYPLLPAGRVGVLLGSGGAGKTRLALSIAIALATGGSWFGYSASRAGAVLFVGGEDEPDEAHRRLAEIIGRLPVEIQSLAWRNIFFEARVGTPSLITDVNSVSKQVEYTRFLHELAEAAKLVPNLGTIFLDPLSRFRGGEENASQ